MRILVASDSFKDGCTSIQACNAIAEGIRSEHPNVVIDICPISDGGEGAVGILQYHLGGELVEVEVCNPLFRLVNAHYLLMDNGTAFIEMAQASGLEHLTRAERNPMNTSTFGTGELIKDALDKGCRTIIISVGGSATNDLGMGMASALGMQFLDDRGNPLAPIGFNMGQVIAMESTKIDQRIAETRFTVITDVANPLYGPQGASYVFGSQKGASDEMMEHLDRGMIHLWQLVGKKGTLNAEAKGYGAAGGMAAGCVAFLDANMESGLDQIGDMIDLQKKIHQADIIITGEGHLDGQTAHGKVISGICRMAKEKTIIALCGKRSISEDAARAMGLDEIININARNAEPAEAEMELMLAQTTFNLEMSARQWMKDYSKS